MFCKLLASTLLLGRARPTCVQTCRNGHALRRPGGSPISSLRVGRKIHPSQITTQAPRSCSRFRNDRTVSASARQRSRSASDMRVSTSSNARDALIAWYLMRHRCVSSRSSRASIPRARSMLRSKLPSRNEIGLGFLTIQEEYYGQWHASVTVSHYYRRRSPSCSSTVTALRKARASAALTAAWLATCDSRSSP